MSRQKLNEDQLYKVVEGLVRKYLKESTDIAGIPSEMGEEEAPMEKPSIKLGKRGGVDLEVPAEFGNDELTQTKYNIYSAFKKGGPERMAKADKYINVINNTVNACSRKHPEWSPEKVEFHIFNKYFDAWTGKETKAEKEARLADRRAEWNSDANAEVRARDAQKKRDARAAAKEQGGM